VELAAAGDLTVPLARTVAFADARDATAMLAGRTRAGSWPGCPARDVATARYDAGLLASGWTAWAWRANRLSPA